MVGVQKRACCASFPGQQHTRVCEARRTRGKRPEIQMFRCRNLACRVLTFDGAAEGMVGNLPCPGCSHYGEAMTR